MIKVGIIAHVSHNKTSLTAAITKVLADAPPPSRGETASFIRAAGGIEPYPWQVDLLDALRERRRKVAEAMFVPEHMLGKRPRP